MGILKRANNLPVVLLLQVALPVFLLLGLLLAIALSVIGERTEERLQRDLRQVARAVQLPVARALELRDVGQLYSSLASVFEISEVYGAYVFDVNGDMLVSFGSVNPSRSQTYRAVELTVDMESELAQYEQISGEQVYSFFLPLFDATGQPNGLLQVTRRRSDIEAELSLLKNWGWASFSAAFLLMLGGLMWTHHRVIGRPIGGLLASMQKVESGDRAHRPPISGPQEIQQISAGLNDMLDAIQSAEEHARTELLAREKMAGKLKEAEAMVVLGQLSAGVAHELGAPLSVVDGRAARLLRHCESETDRMELEAIRQQVGRMSSLVEQLLSFGRSSRAPQSSVALSELFGRLVAAARESGWQLRLEAGPDVHIKGDLFSLEQALVNLVRNAVQACPDEEVIAGWQHAEDGDTVTLFVEDAGPGVAHDLEEQIFEPFVTTKLPGEGSGMGLAIVQRVVRDHQGHIRVLDSALGGARFELDFAFAGEPGG